MPCIPGFTQKAPGGRVLIEGDVLLLRINSRAPAARRAAKQSPITIGTGSHACMEIETHATLFSW